MKNNLLANGLLIMIGVLLLIAATQMLGWGSSLESFEAEDFDAKQLPSLDQAENPNGEGSDDNYYAGIIATPLFSATREPFVPPEDTGEDGGEPEEVVEADPLNVQVTSIVITAEKSFVMLLDKATNKQLTLKEGMPLEGDQGLWFVEKIDPRMVTFAADNKEPVEMELEIFKKALKSDGPGNKRNKPKKRRNENKNQNTITPVDQAKNKKNSAEEIRKKIAERRAQMRADAANRKQ